MIIQGIVFAAPGFRYCNINLFKLLSVVCLLKDRVMKVSVLYYTLTTVSNVLYIWHFCQDSYSYTISN